MTARVRSDTSAPAVRANDVNGGSKGSWADVAASVARARCVHGERLRCSVTVIVATGPSVCSFEEHGASQQQPSQLR